MRYAIRALSVTICLGFLGMPLAIEAQQAMRTARVGYLGDRPTKVFDIFRGALREHGWVEGQNMNIDARWAEGKVERLPDLAAELVRLNVDVILAPSSTQVEPARQATKTIPIVFAAHADPVGLGHVASLARPGGNVTGVSQLLTELSAKELQILKEALPHVTRVAVLWNPTTPSHAPALKAVEVAAQTLGVELRMVEARSVDELEPAFSAMIKERVGGFLVVASPLTFVQRARLAELAFRYRLPGMFGFRENAEAGGLMSYGPDLGDMFRRAADYVDRILKGARPADLPVEQATKFDLVINLKAAKVLGVTIPQSSLIRATEVIQ